MQGIVSFYNRTKAWGFVTPDDLSADLFIHISNLPANHKYVNEGDLIEFEIGDFRGKPVALRIRILAENANPMNHISAVRP